MQRHYLVFTLESVKYAILGAAAICEAKATPFNDMSSARNKNSNRPSHVAT